MPKMQATRTLPLSRSARPLQNYVRRWDESPLPLDGRGLG